MSLLLDMPERGILNQVFEPEENDAVSPERGGRLGSVTLGFSIWTAQWSLSPNMTRAASNEWRAFRARLRKSKRPFLAYDRDRLFPLNYSGGFGGLNRAGGGSFDGSATSWLETIDTDAESTLRLTGLPANLELEYGDYIGFKWDAAGSPAGTYDRRTLARAVAPATANGSGVIDVLSEPPLSDVVPSGAVAHLDRPACIMKALPGQFRLGALDRRQKIAGGSLSAVQDLRP